MMAWTSPAFTLRFERRAGSRCPPTRRRGGPSFRAWCLASSSAFSRPLPSRQTPSSFCASTANSMGSSLKTSLQKPFTIMLTASSAEMPALLEVEDLVLADLRGRGLVLHLGASSSAPRCRGRCGRRTGRRGAASRTASSCGALVGALADLHQAAVGVLAVAGGDALGDDRALRVLADVDHLGAGVGLLVVVGDGHRVELADRVVALQDAARVLPGDGGAGLHLGPGDLRAACPGTCRAWSRSCRCRPCRPCRRGTSSAPSST